jgi:3-phenylpropionate/trans-cinnamate dioxygenase ferredoxin reductase subunit
MTHYKYLIVGAGMAGGAAVNGIRNVDKEGTIGLIGDETYMPYDRPLLSKGLWKNKTIDDVWKKTPTENVTFHLGKMVQQLKRNKKQVQDNEDNIYTYDKLLLATGGTPRRFPFGGDGILYFRSLNDYKHLRQWADEDKHFIVIGGGYIGSEIAAALAMNGKKVTLLFPEDGIGGSRFPADLSHFLVDYYRQKGVQVIPGEMVKDVNKDSNGWVVQTEKENLTADAVIAGIGIQVNAGLAEEAGLEVKNGIRVNPKLQTSDAHIYAAGDVASFYNSKLGEYVRFEHEVNAKRMGRAAGENMAGKNSPYDELPYYYSDMFDLGYEAVGKMNNKMDIEVDWKEPMREGILYYLEKDVIKGVLLWNVWEKVEQATALISRNIHEKNVKIEY